MSQSFVVYLFKGDQADFRRHFDRKFSLDFKPQVSLSFSKPSADVADRYSADSPTDILVTVTPRGTLTPDEEQRVIEAVQYAARETGSAMSPVR